jgi:transcriptional regulator with XRE-family HTH domain
MSIETALRIKKIREYRNYTQQYMADSLELSQNAYCKIENGTTKLTIDRLENIATILDVPLESILSSSNQTFNIQNNDKLYGHIENLYEANKELLEKQIALLQQQNENLLKTIEVLTKKG